MLDPSESVYIYIYQGYDEGIMTTVFLSSLVFVMNHVHPAFRKSIDTCYLPPLVIVVDSSPNHVSQGHHRQRLHFHGHARPGMLLFGVLFYRDR